VADVVGEELLPGAVPDRVVGGEVAALAVAGEHRPGQVDRQHWPPPPGHTQVGSQQVGGGADLGAAHVRHPSGRGASGEGCEAVGDFGGVDRLEAGGGRDRYHRQPGQAAGH